MSDDLKIKCSYLNKCKCCVYGSISYEEEIEKKKAYLNVLFKKYGGVSYVVKCSQPYHYRFKVTAVLEADVKGRITAGMVSDSSGEVLDVFPCAIEEKGASLIIRDTAKLLSDFKIKAYNRNSGYGLVKYLQVRVSSDAEKNRHYMLTIVTRSPIFPSKNNFIRELRKIHPEIETVVQNINDRTDSLVIAEREKILYGKGYLVDNLLGNNFKISSKSFYQVNGIQTRVLYQTAIDMLKLKGDEKVMDAYCGTGTIGISLSGKAKSVVGVELNSQAVRDAKDNAKHNRINNISFVNADAAIYINDIKNSHKFDVIIMDPPRRGSSKEFIDAVISMAPEKVLYISCGPEALAEELALFEKKYKVSKLIGVDMFSRTGFAEVCALLTRQNMAKAVRGTAALSRG